MGTNKQSQKQFKTFYVAVADHYGASQLFSTKKEAEAWVDNQNPTYGKLLFKIQEWHLNPKDLEQLESIK